MIFIPLFAESTEMQDQFLKSFQQPQEDKPHAHEGHVLDGSYVRVSEWLTFNCLLRGNNAATADTICRMYKQKDVKNYFQALQIGTLGISAGIGRGQFTLQTLKCALGYIFRAPSEVNKDHEI